MKKISNFLKLAIINGSIILSAVTADAQAKSGISIGPALNASKDGSGYGFVFQGEIKIVRSFSLVPVIGVEIPYVGYAGFGGKYYLTDKMFISAGGFLHVGGEDAGDTGFGGTAAIGFEIFSAKKHSIDLCFHGDLFKIDREVAPLGGVRLTYNFSFSKR